MKNHRPARQRMRAQGACLSHQGVTIDTIACIDSVDRETVAVWFNRWEHLGIVGLQDKVRSSGRSEKLTPKEQARVRELFKVHPRAPKAQRFLKRRASWSASILSSGEAKKPAFAGNLLAAP